MKCYSMLDIVFSTPIGKLAYADSIEGSVRNPILRMRQKVILSIGNTVPNIAQKAGKN